jgi:hypothetical protein
MEFSGERRRCVCVCIMYIYMRMDERKSRQWTVRQESRRDCVVGKVSESGRLEL